MPTEPLDRCSNATSVTPLRRETPVEAFCDDPNTQDCRIVVAADAYAPAPGGKNGCISANELRHWDQGGPLTAAFVEAPSRGFSLQRIVAVEQRLAQLVPGLQAEKEKLARSRVRALGSATSEDLAVAVAKLARFPTRVLELMQAVNVGVVVCRGDITDAVPSLKGVRPRGWPEGMTWDNPGVPGVYFPQQLHGTDFVNSIAIATIDDPANPGQRIIPPTGYRHSSADLFVHELLHMVNANLFSAMRAAELLLSDAPAAGSPPAPPNQSSPAPGQSTMLGTIPGLSIATDEVTHVGWLVLAGADGKQQKLRWTEREILGLGTSRVGKKAARDLSEWQLLNLGFEHFAERRLLPLLGDLPTAQQRLAVWQFYAHVIKSPVQDFEAVPPPPADHAVAEERAAAARRAAQLASQKGRIIFSQWDTEFLAARAADWDNLGAYYRQGGKEAITNASGSDEWFAESAAMNFNANRSERERLARDFPATFAFWERNPFAKRTIRIDPNSSPS